MSKEERAVIEAAARAFCKGWMPLEACLSLRDHLAQRSQEPDLLATVFQAVYQQPVGIRNPELRVFIGQAQTGGWALSIETIELLVDIILEIRPSAILEFGSGTSSLVLAWVMERLYGASHTPHVFSIDQSPSYLERTRELLQSHGLGAQVRFLQAELIPQAIGSCVTRCYGLSPRELERFFEGARPDLVIVDGPAGENGVRFGTIPLVRDRLASNARIYLDDGLRDSELDTADRWSRLGYVRWDGIRWEGKGLWSGRVLSVPPASIQRWLETAPQPTSTWREFTDPQTSIGSVNARSELSTCLPNMVIQDARDSVTDLESVMRRSPSARPKCLFLNTYYPAFLEHHYQHHPELAGAPYDVQHKSLQETGFGDSDFYSVGLQVSGWDAQSVIVNCPPLQRQWAHEHGVSIGHALLSTTIEQIKRIRPQVLYLQDLSIGTTDFLSSVRPYVELIVGQIASPIPSQAHLDGFDLLISSFPHFVDEFRRAGRLAYYQPLAFDPRLVQRLGNCSREYPLTFVGGLSPAHRERQELFAALGKSTPIHFWGYGTQTLAQLGIEQARLHGEAWGMDMFTILAKSAITVNHHIDVAKSNANNMRLFEATGCGALLVTDYKDNLSDLFEIGSEVVTYRSVQECAELINYYLAHEDEASVIAKRGQERTLKDHTYEIRMRHTAELLDRHLQLKIGAHRLPEPDLHHVSYGHEAIQPSQVTTDLIQSWRSDRIPLKQRALVQSELQAMYRGNPPVVFRVLADVLRAHVRPYTEVLEIGCASGYYYEVLEYLLKTRLSYVGIDFSDAMIRLARLYYPQTRFEVGDGGALRFQERSVPIVISSCVLLHVREYAMHIAEAARVASEVVVFHRTPTARRTETRHYKKFAYGVETFELRFNETELLNLCRQAELELITQCEYNSHPERDEFETTYVFRAAA